MDQGNSLFANDEYVNEMQNIEDDFNNRSTRKRLNDNLCLPSTSTEIVESSSNTEEKSALKEKLQTNALFDGQFFKFLNINGKNIEAKCSLCFPNDVRIRGPIVSTSNFLKHLRKKHPNSIEAYQAYKAERKQLICKSQTDNVLDLNKNASKQITTPVYLAKQRKIEVTHCQDFDARLIKFFVETMIPLSVVEHESFKNLFIGMDVAIMNQMTLIKKIDDLYNDMVNYIKQQLNTVKYVCITADIWFVNRKRFFGVTCHWLGIDLKRHSMVLACQRFSGTISYDKITEILQNIYNQYNLTIDKVVAIIINNSNNFVKAFTEFDIKLELDYQNENEDYDHESDDDTDNLLFMSINLVQENVKKFTNTLKSNVLPKYIRSISHTLNLIATTDLNNALNTYKTHRFRHQNMLMKCNNLWKKAANSKNAEVISVLGQTLNYSSINNCNSFYHFILQIVQHEEKLKELFDRLEIKEYFDAKEILYLREFCDILKPIADTLEFLQNENYTYFGYVIPSLISLKVKLEKLMMNMNLKFANIILEKVIEGLLTRFGNYFSISNNSSEAIIAAVTIPSIKLRWLNALGNDIVTHKQDIQKFIIRAVEEMQVVLEATTVSENKIGFQSNKDVAEIMNFFDFNEPPTKQIENDHLQQINNIELEYLNYLDDRRTNIEILNEYPIIRRLFIRYNTTLSSSAPVEKLFSFATHVNPLKPHGLSDNLFEKFVLLKGNG